MGWTIFWKEITVLIVINFLPFICARLTPTKESKKQTKKIFLLPTDRSLKQVKFMFWKIFTFPFLKHIMLRKSERRTHACNSFMRMKSYPTICGMTYLLKWNLNCYHLYTCATWHSDALHTDKVWFWCWFFILNPHYTGYWYSEKHDWFPTWLCH